MKHLNHAWVIAVKDLKIFGTDRMALFFFLLFPFFFVVLFNLMMGGVGGQDERLTLYVSSQESENGLSHQIINTLVTEETAKLKPGSPVIKSIDYTQATQDIEAGKLSGFLSFPAEFTQGLMTGSGTHIDIIADSKATNMRASLYGLSQAIANEINWRQVTAQSISVLIGSTPGSSEIIESVIYSKETQQPVIDFAVEQVGPIETPPAGNWLIPGYLVMFVFFAAALGAESIVTERQNHTLERLLSASLRRESILGGKFLGTAIKGMIQILLFWAVGIVVFKINVGYSPFAVVLLSLLVVVMSSAFGTMLASLVTTARSAGSIAVLASLLLAPLGGCWWPLFITPHWMQFIAKISPHAWATTAFNKLLLFGASFSDVVPEIIALAGFAVAFAVMAVWRFRARVS